MNQGPIARRITAILEQKGWSKADLGRATGIPYHRLNPWFMRVNSKPNGPDLDAVAKALGVTTGHLVNGDPVPSRSGRDTIVSTYDMLSPDRREQLEGFAEFLLAAEKARDSEQDPQ